MARANHPQRRTRLCYVMTDSVSTCFLQGQLRHFRQEGYEVTLITASGERLDQAGQAEGVATYSAPMVREIHPGWDLVALLRLVMLFWRIRPDIVNAGTPKGGLLGMMAAWLTGVPVRIYTLHGLRLETTTGLKYRLLRTTERIASWCSTRILCVSQSLRDSYYQLKLTDSAKLNVLGCGSCNGMDTSRFRPANQEDEQQAFEVRQALGIPSDAMLLLAVGRLTRDKGLPELEAAFGTIQQEHPTAQLVLVGSFEAGDAVSEECRSALVNNPAIHLVGQVADPRPYYWAADLLVHASLREGFPYAPLEAAACGLAVVGCHVTGVRDAVVPGVTGTLVPAEDPEAFAMAVCQYLGNPTLAKRQGQAARERVVTEYRQEHVWQLLSRFYRKQLGHADPMMTDQPSQAA